MVCDNFITAAYISHLTSYSTISMTLVVLYLRNFNIYTYLIPEKPNFLYITVNKSTRNWRDYADIVNYAADMVRSLTLSIVLSALLGVAPEHSQE